MPTKLRYGAEVTRTNNVVSVSGKLSGTTGGYGVLSAFHRAVHSAGYEEVFLDLTECTAVFCSAILPICSQAMQMRLRGINTKLILPDDPTLVRLFVNANWANLIDPINYPPSSYRRMNSVPATVYASAEEQTVAVNRILSAVLGSLENIDRNNLAALEWSLNEITDNVLMHSESAIGGVVEVNLYPKAQSVEFLVCDGGLGIPNSLRSSFHDLTDVDALDKAIREGVTRDRTIGRGNGLFGTSQVCSISNGEFAIASGYASLGYTSKGLIIKTQAIPFNGTLIMAKISYAEKGLLERALVFQGQNYRPVDFIEVGYEDSEEEVINFKLKNESDSFGTRPAGAVVRRKLMGLLRVSPDSKVRVNFDEVAVISSSFADEVFGKMFAALGPVVFTNKMEFVRMNSTVAGLVDKAIRERASG